MEGVLRKKGNHLYSMRFKKKYYFYLEEHVLKYGREEGKPTKLIDFSKTWAEVSVSQKYKTQFKIRFRETAGRKDKLKLKADNEQKRDEWVEALRKQVEKFA